MKRKTLALILSIIFVISIASVALVVNYIFSNKRILYIRIITSDWIKASVDTIQLEMPNPGEMKNFSLTLSSLDDEPLYIWMGTENWQPYEPTNLVIYSDFEGWLPAGDSVNWIIHVYMKEGPLLNTDSLSVDVKIYETKYR